MLKHFTFAGRWLRRVSLYSGQSEQSHSVDFFNIIDLFSFE